MTQTEGTFVILLADDDAEDRTLVADALRESNVANDLRTVADGEELLEYLRGEGKYASEAVPRPGVILLDLNMPRKNGHEALREIKSDSCLRQIPVVVLTTSRDQEDVFRSYDLGVNSYVSKPGTFADFVAAMKTLDGYWFQLVDLPVPTP